MCKYLFSVEKHIAAAFVETAIMMRGIYLR
jgi:hypothetical protein